MVRVVGYQLGFYIVWWTCVLGAATGWPWVGPAAAAAWIGVHLGRAPSPRCELGLIAFAGGFGLVADQILIRFGELDYLGLPEGSLLGPAWILAIWMAFAPSINVTFPWLHGRPWLASALGIGGGLFAYAAGRRLGVVEFDLTQIHSLVALALVWGGGLPLLVRAAERTLAASAAGQPAR